MAESFPLSISTTILRAIDKLLSKGKRVPGVLQRETNRVKEALVKIRDELLKLEKRHTKESENAEEQQKQKRKLQEHLAKISDQLYDTEDVFDELEYDVRVKQVSKLHLSVKYYSKIKDIRKKLDVMVADNKSIIKVENPVSWPDYSRKLVINHTFMGTSDVFGRSQDKENIIKDFLMKPNKEDKRVSVIPIVGTGGIGKTTLAKEVYSDKRIDEYFPLKMWIRVPEDFDIITLMKETCISAIGKKTDVELADDKLEGCLLQALAGKRFLLVLDDVWNENNDKWEKFKNLLTQEANESKIVVTTRSTEAAKIMRTVDNYELKGLSQEDSMSLFEKSAFIDAGDETCQKLTDIGREIVEKCDGVPLAVKTIGTLLYQNTDMPDWVRIKDDEIWKEDQIGKKILSVLKLSYASLPSHLRRCLAYCSLFPRRHCFNSNYLVYHWMAHGFLATSTEKDSEMEDVGMQYLEKLFLRCFFQDVEDHGYFFTFKMHDLIYDLVEEVGQRDCKTVDLRILHSDVNARHLSFLGVGNSNKKVPSTSNNFRTIIMQSLQAQSITESFDNKWISNFKCLRLLCLSGLKFKELPESVGALKHLRFLDLSDNSDLEKLYETICKLLSLQTLILLGCSALKNLPTTIQKMISLRYLELTIQWERLPQIGAECFKSLQYLHLYKCTNLESLREGMESLTTIRTLVLQGCDSLNSLPDNVILLERLEKLVISSCPKLNLKMDLQGENLSLKLKVFMIYELKELQDVPQLILQGSANSLEYIRIEKCSKLTELPAWLEKLTALQKLEIVSCSGLSSLPDGMEKLTALQKLEIVSCSGLSSLPAGMEKLTALRELKIQKSPRLSDSCRQKPLKIPNLEIHLDPEGASSSRDKE